MLIYFKLLSWKMLFNDLACMKLIPTPRNHGGSSNFMLFLSKEECQHSTFGGWLPSMPSLEMADGQPLTWLLCVAAAVEIRLLQTVVTRVFFFYLLKLIYYIFSLEIWPEHVCEKLLTENGKNVKNTTKINFSILN